jgi:hypothetical protein
VTAPGPGGAVVLLMGAGAVGARTARQLIETPGVERVLVVDRRAARVDAVVAAMGARAEAFEWFGDGPLPEGIAAVACALPSGAEQEIASRALEAGVPFASAGDDERDLNGLRSLSETARRSGVAIIAGCGLAPGLADVLARHAADAFDQVDEIGVARSGTAGDACVATAGRALRERPGELRDGGFEETRRWGGHELIWFPEPLGPQECERVATGVQLLHEAVPDAGRITVRLSRPESGPGARFLRRKDPEGTWGAIRVEVWGRRGAAREPIVYGAIERTAIAAGTVLGLTTAALAGTLPGLLKPSAGVFGLGAVAEPRAFLAELARRGVKAAIFEGVPVA